MITNQNYAKNLNSLWLLPAMIYLFWTHTACTPKASQNDFIDLQRNDKVSVFDIFSEVSVVQLQTPPEVMMAEVIQVEYFDSHYYTLDMISQKIFCFDEQGKYIFHIAAQGKGPGEYNYITHFSIDQRNRQLVLMDPAVQRVLFFDLHGQHLRSHTFALDKVMGLSQAYLLSDSILLVTSITHEHLFYYCLLTEKVIFADYDYSDKVASTLGPFSSSRVYQYNNRYYGLLPLSQDVADLTNRKPVLAYQWNFGKHNNHNKQWERLLMEFGSEGANMRYPSQAVGTDKYLHHAFWSLAENHRFKFAMIEFDQNWKHIIIDKKNQTDYVFTEFDEKIVLIPSAVFFSTDRFVTIEIPEIETIRNSMPPELSHRNFSVYNLDLLSPNACQIIANHNPMTDNPFLVVYKFKE